jgi:hypothetical protein
LLYHLRAILLVHPHGSVVHSKLCHECSWSLCKVTFSCQDEKGQLLYESIHVDDLVELLTQLVSGPLGQWYLETRKTPLAESDVTSHLLREYLRAGNRHPARDYPGLFSTKFPHAALSYEWKGMLDVSNLNVLRNPLVLNHPELVRSNDVYRERDGKADPRVWVDIFFIDQTSKNIRVELGIAQKYYISCSLHIVAGSESLFTCGWCLWELGLRAHAKKGSLIVGSLGNTAAKLGNTGKFFENMKLDDPSDKEAIEQGLLRVFDYNEDNINRAIAAQIIPSAQDVVVQALVIVQASGDEMLHLLQKISCQRTA